MNEVGIPETLYAGGSAGANVGDRSSLEFVLFNPEGTGGDGSDI